MLGKRVNWHTTTTVIVPSRRNPQQPHIVNVYPNGKCECDKSCPGFSVENICAHLLVARLKMSRLKDFLHCFVTTKVELEELTTPEQSPLECLLKGEEKEKRHLEREKKDLLPQLRCQETRHSNSAPLLFKHNSFQHFKLKHMGTLYSRIFFNQ